MRSPRTLDFPCWARVLLLVAAAASVLGQQQNPGAVADSLKRVRAGQLLLPDIHNLAEAGAVEAIPPLREQFSLQKEPLLKAGIASALVRLGERDAAYWVFLLNQARIAAESDAPSLYLVDAKGKVVRGRGRFSQAFQSWAKKQDLDVGKAAQAQVQELPIYLTLLGVTGDRRGREVLRKALQSRNFMIQGNAARGLAKLGDRESIPAIITACRKAPAKEMAGWVARALVFFDDPKAQKAADQFIPDKKLLAELRKQAREKRPDPFSS